VVKLLGRYGSMNSEFWKNKKVFITGHTGFKGSWLTQILIDMGADITGYSLPAIPTSLFNLLDLQENIHHIEADIRNKERLEKEIVKANPDIVLHLAAQALVRDSYIDPVNTFDTNILGTVKVLEAARQCSNIRSIVVVTTDKCYLNNNTGQFFKEDDSLGGKDPYSASKAAAEIVSNSYYESFFKETDVCLATARAGNVIGGGDWAKDRLIPDVFRSCLSSKPVIIRNPAATRPWQHVLEPLRGYMMLAEKLYTDGEEYTGGWNFGPEIKGIQTVGTVLSLLKETLAFDLQLDKSKQPEEAKTLALDINKAKNQLNWNPLLSLDEAVRMTGEWYKAIIENKEMKKITIEQYKHYFSLTK